MRQFTRDFTRIEKGYAIVKAKSIKEARERFDDNDADDYLSFNTEVEWDLKIREEKD